MNAAMLRAQAEALESGEQCDEDGVMIKVSREAAHYAAIELRAEAARLEAATPVGKTPSNQEKIAAALEEAVRAVDELPLGVQKGVAIMALQQAAEIAARTLRAQPVPRIQERETPRTDAKVHELGQATRGNAHALIVEARELERELNAALAAKPAAVPEGWRLVPVELPEEMRRQGFGASAGKLGARALWRAMLAAAPEAPAVVGEQPCEHDWREFYTGSMVTHRICAKCEYKEPLSHPSPTPQAAPAAPSLDAASGVPVAHSDVMRLARSVLRNWGHSYSYWQIDMPKEFDRRLPPAHHVKALEALDEALNLAVISHPIPGSGVASGDWQPIETAPKDGRWILLDWNGHTVPAHYLDNSKTAHPWQGWRLPSLWSTPSGQPIGWAPMPLPTPPKE